MAVVNKGSTYLLSLKRPVLRASYMEKGSDVVVAVDPIVLFHVADE